MTGVYLREISERLEVLRRDSPIDLFAWSRQVMTVCSTRAIYGPENPFTQDPSLVDAFWQFDRDLNVLIADVAPALFAPKGYHARKKMGAAFQTYYNGPDTGPRKGSGMAQARFSAATEYGITTANQGLLETGALLGVLANTIPTTFYMILHLFANLELLKDARDEMERICVSVGQNPKDRVIHIMTMRERCPLMHSTLQELLRLHALGTGSRYVREDVMLNDKYLLKKGMIIQMPMAVMHGDPAVWGPDSNIFNPRRFLKGSGTKINMAAYRPFGGGAAMCPGRHFVALEIMALAACMVMRFDMEPVSGKWTIPAQKQESLATNVFPPDKDIQVRVSRRQGLGDIKWAIAMD